MLVSVFFLPFFKPRKYQIQKKTKVRIRKKQHGKNRDYTYDSTTWVIVFYWDSYLEIGFCVPRLASNSLHSGG